ncbi:hypothetical protein IFM89_011461 [Coptis chinensis]|uniref:P-loop containing nucleoside triphosphate hydrolases superfamily protein n=1 Tax=Coptis chinensis TaxID=261450 RepID=A0A835IWB2_9MAGN|nr:hypothetical protein IFM89_011461 [Coptis chinensis]
MDELAEQNVAPSDSSGSTVARTLSTDLLSRIQKRVMDSEQAKKEKVLPGLVYLVLSWTLRQILDEKYYKYKVEKIPKTFTSVHHYLRTYRNPLIEETHADLLSSMSTLFQAPVCEIIAVEENEDYKLPDNLLYDIKYERQRDEGNKRDTYEPQMYDVFALTTSVKPKCVDDLNRPPKCYLPAVVVGVGDEDDNPDLFTILTSKPLLEQEYQEKNIGVLYATFLINIATNIRIWKALHGGENVNILKEVLNADSKAEDTCEICSSQETKQDVNVDLHSMNLNGSQIDAISSSLETRRCSHKNSVRLIWGPPGTGKTKTISTMLWALLRMRCRTLTCAPTNIAVKEVASRVVKLVIDSIQNDLYGLGDIVLYGNKKRMKVDENSNLSLAFLDYRVVRLLDCFVPLTGWNHQLNSMIALLDDPGSEYHLYLEDIKKRNEEAPTFLDYMRNRFGGTMKNLKYCIPSTSATLHSVQHFDLLIIDEAAQLKECESAIPLQLPSLRHAILIGDERQLPAMVKSKISEEAGFGTSLFERLVSLGKEKHLLNIQYRMHPSISLFPNSEFYAKQISDAPNVKDERYKKNLLQGKMYGSYSFINVSFGKDEFDDGHSRRNMAEVAVVSEIVAKLYQGGEEDVIIISTVRSNGNGSVGFLSNRQRTNVAITRARYCLWILGNGSTLLNSDSVWKKLVLDAQSRGCYFDAEKDETLAKTLIDSMLQHGQLDDLLNTNSMLFRGARWKLIFWDDFGMSLARIKNVETRKEVLSLLMKLSNGWRHPPQRQKNLILLDGTSSQLLELYEVHGLLNLLWTVDVIMEGSKFIQVLKFWAILPSTEVPRLAKRLDVIFGSYTVDNMNRCKFKCLEGQLEVPQSWEISQDAVMPGHIHNSKHERLLNQFSSLRLNEGPSRIRSRRAKQSRSSRRKH